MEHSSTKSYRILADPRVSLVTLAVWAVAAVVFASLAGDSTGRDVVAGVIYWTCAAGAATTLMLAFSNTAEKAEKIFWGMLGAGLLVRFAGFLVWLALRDTTTAAGGVLLPQALYLVSYALLFGTLLLLVSITARRISGVWALDSLGIMLSVGMVIYYFVLDPAVSAGLLTGRESIAVLARPVFDAALLFFALVTFSASRKPPYAGSLSLGFTSLLIADAIYLSGINGGPYEIGRWPEMLAALGILFLGLAALRAVPTSFEPHNRISPWRTFLFWFGPLSPLVHFSVLLVWGALNPPLPAYVLAGCAALLLYAALRVSLVSFVNQRMNREQQQEARRLEQGRILYDLHDSVKQSVHGISLTLSAAAEAERRGNSRATRENLGRALSAARETEYRVSQPYDELWNLDHTPSRSLGDFLRHRLSRFEEYFGIKTHADLRVPLESLNPKESAAANRFATEAFWNVAKHSGARNLYLESRQVGGVLLLRVRDDGRGFDPSKPNPGLGLKFLRQRAREAGANLDVISRPGAGTTLQLRFDRR